MTGPNKLAIALWLLLGTQTLAHAQETRGESRGGLLYETHCSACHASKIHWRKQRLATDWNSLKAQVRRWQASIGLNWSDEEITEVTHYLNRIHYRFPVADRNGYLQKKKSSQAMRQSNRMAD